MDKKKYNCFTIRGFLECKKDEVYQLTVCVLYIGNMCKTELVNFRLYKFSCGGELQIWMNYWNY